MLGNSPLSTLGMNPSRFAISSLSPCLDLVAEFLESVHNPFNGLFAKRLSLNQPQHEPVKHEIRVQPAARCFAEGAFEFERVLSELRVPMN